MLHSKGNMLPPLRTRADEAGQRVAERGRGDSRRIAAPAADNPWGAGVAFGQVGSVGFEGQIELEALRLFRLPLSVWVVKRRVP